jgi:ADP-ribose pyrophosphatase
MPEILARKVIPISPWVNLVEKTVREDDGVAPAVYHFLSQAPYVGIVVQVPDRRIAVVRQYRPCVEEYTWEFPAGTIDAGETAEQAARRELLEETGLAAHYVLYLGDFLPDTGRLAVESHIFYMRAALTPLPEKGIELRFVTHGELKVMIRTREFRHQIHLAAYTSALMAGISLD